MAKNLVTRRDLLKGAGIGALGLGLGAKLTVEPAAAQMEPMLGAVYSMPLGDFEVTVIRDGNSAITPDRLAVNADVEEVTALLAANGFPTGELRNVFKPMLVNTGDNLVLIDTGLGAGSGAGGQLFPTLELIGVSLEDINTVAITHWHPDHIGGILVDGSPAFPNATYMFPQVEWDFVQSVPTGNDGLDETLTGIAENFQIVMDNAELTFFASDEELVPGIQAIASFGHTPGHHAFHISSGDAGLLNVGDAIANPVVSVQRTDWHFGFDADGETAVESRRMLLERANSDGHLLFSYHFPFPGIGYVGVGDEENSWRFNAASY